MPLIAMGNKYVIEETPEGHNIYLSSINIAGCNSRYINRKSENSGFKGTNYMGILLDCHDQK